MSQDQNPYDFIVNSDQNKRRFSAPQSIGTRIAIVAGGAAILLIIIIVIFSAIFGGSDNNQQFLKVLQSQQEIARVTQLQEVATADQSVKNIANSTRLAVSSDQKQLTTTLASFGREFNQKDIALGQNPQTDEQLTAAKAAGNFDTTFLTVLTKHLQTYQSSLQQAYDATENETVRNQLQEDYTSSGLLMKQIESTKP